MDVIQPRKLVHSGKKMAYPSSYVWDCVNCNQWNIWKTRNFYGQIKVCCSACASEFLLDKEKPREIVTRKKSDGAII